MAGELICVCQAKARLDLRKYHQSILDLRGPVVRVTGFDVPYPYWQIEDAYVPSVERVVAAGQRLLSDF